MDWKVFILELFKTLKFDNRTNRWLLSITVLISVVLSRALFNIFSNSECLVEINRTLLFSVLVIVFFFIIFTIIDTFWYLCINRFISRIVSKSKLENIRSNKKNIILM